MKISFARAFWRLFRGYWRSEEKKRAIGLLAVVIAMNFAMVYLLVQLNSWYNEFYNALQAYEYSLFWPLIGKFSLLAFIYIGIAVYAIYLRQLLEIRWRTWMTGRYLTSWLKDQAHYRLQVVGNGGMDNPDVALDAGGERYHLEIKRTERFSLYPAMDQAERDANGHAVPVVVHRSNRKPWVCVLRLADFLRLVNKAP